MTRIYWLVCALLLAVAAPQARAASCSVSSAGTAFGVYVPTNSSSVTTIGTITVNCTGTIGETILPVISLSTGSGTYTSRTMKSGSSILTYNLYLGPINLLVWGDLSLGTVVTTDTYILLSNSISKTYNVYGTMPGSQTTATPGSYLDNITVTLSY